MLAGLSLVAACFWSPQQWATFEGGPGPGRGKRIVLLAGDEEYRSEEALPQLAKVLSLRHGFRCAVLFSVGKDGSIDPERRDHQPGLHLLKDADLVVMMLRFRSWPDDQMRHFDAYLRSGKPILALRTSTHAFDIESGPFERYGWRSKSWPGGFGKQVLGETWVSHWGEHGKQATRGVPEPSAAGHPILRGVSEVFVPTDVYEAHPPRDAQVLMRGQVVAGMSPFDPPASHVKQNAIGREQPINDPMMPIVWTRRHERTQVLVATMGSAQDLLNEGFRRLLVNGAYWLCGLTVPEKADIRLVGTYEPSPFGFGRFQKGARPAGLMNGATPKREASLHSVTPSGSE